MWRYEKSSDSVLLVFEDHWVGEETFESKPDPIEIGFNYHEATISPFLSLRTQRRLEYSLTDSSGDRLDVNVSQSTGLFRACLSSVGRDEKELLRRRGPGSCSDRRSSQPYRYSSRCWCWNRVSNGGSCEGRRESYRSRLL